MDRGRAVWETDFEAGHIRGSPVRAIIANYVSCWQHEQVHVYIVRHSPEIGLVGKWHYKATTGSVRNLMLKLL